MSISINNSNLNSVYHTPFSNKSECANTQNESQSDTDALTQNMQEGQKSNENSDFTDTDAYSVYLREKYNAVGMYDISEVNTSEEASENLDTNENPEENKNQKQTLAVNEGKLLRMIAAAKTKDQLQAVMAKLSSEMQQVKDGKANGMCDQSEIDKVTKLVASAKQKMSSVDSREASPSEEMAFMLSSLM